MHTLKKDSPKEKLTQDIYTGNLQENMRNDANGLQCMKCCSIALTVKLF